MWLSLIKNPLVSGLLIMLALAVMTDSNTHKIPNILVLFGLVVSLFCQTLLLEGAGGLNWLAGVVIAFTGFVPIYIVGGMAAGDVKLMMAVGGFLGYPLIINALACSYIAGGLLAIIYVIFKGKLLPLLHNLRSIILSLLIKTTTDISVENTVLQNSVGRMPYALAIATGSIIALYLKYADLKVL